jgi:heme/copper-type cytochrome/quinol oxidase subunit 1
MPRLSVWFIRASLLYLTIGFTFGALMLANEGFAMDLHIDQLLPAHMEFLLPGWIMQLALGVAYWILPRYVKGPPRGNDAMAWLSLIFLNTGILLVTINTFFPSAWFVVLGRVFEAVSILAFLLVSLRRVRPSR